MEQIAAIVVTYNRKELLHQCIEKLLAQQKAACDILIVDNASTDGTGAEIQALAKRQPHLFYRNTGANLGGAGGFNFGVRWAVETGYSYLWLMDDDTLPCPNALAELWNAHEQLQGNYGWLSSVVLWTDGTECKMNRPKLKKSFYKYLHCLKYGIIQAEQSTFVSLFLKKETVHSVGLPIKEFFIWGDDIEYTRRIAIRFKIDSFVVGTSQVIHAMKENNGSDIATDNFERIERYKYAFRNESYLYRKEGLKGATYYWAKCIKNIVRILSDSNDFRLKRIKVLLNSIILGFFFMPDIEQID